MQLIYISMIIISACFCGIVFPVIIDAIVARKLSPESIAPSFVKTVFKFRSFNSLSVKKYGEVIAYIAAILLGWIILSQKTTLNFESILIMAAFSLLVLISVIDIKIRRIPNELVIMLFAVSLIYVGMRLINSNNSILTHIIGLLVGGVLFLIPFLFKSDIGGGDIKLIAVMGFCLGYPGILKAIIIMCLGIFIYLIYLKLFKKGGLKTTFAMAPYISLGYIITLLF